jgi:hypothetical protein
MAWHFSAWLHATGQLPSANRTWSAAVHDGQLTWNQEAGAVVPKPLGMAAGRQHGLNGKGPVLSHGKSWQLFDAGSDILRAQRATKLRRAAAPSGAAGAAWRRAAPP